MLPTDRKLTRPPVVFILGGSGMLGSAVARVFSDRFPEVWVSVRPGSRRTNWPRVDPSKILEVDALDPRTLVIALRRSRPMAVVNCIGIVKQVDEARDPISSITVNALFPHQLAAACRTVGARLIHVSTDCVFDGIRGYYDESDEPNPKDLYGRSKLLGELTSEGCVTIRTSIIGHENVTKHGLVEWFLSQDRAVKGFQQAIFTGFPTVELANIIADHVIPRVDLPSLLHVSADAIDKYSLLKLIAEKYEHNIPIEPDNSLRIDRSLDSTLFRTLTRYSPPTWRELISAMYEDWKTTNG